MKTLLVALMLMLGLAASADSQLIPLVGASDPLLITNAMIQFADDGRSSVVVELENRTALPVDVESIQLNVTRFYTRSESEQRGRQVWDCGRSGHVERTQEQVIASHTRAVVVVPLSESCEHHREHEHFFVTLERLQGYHSREPAWKRDPKELVEMLAAAQPHP